MSSSLSSLCENFEADALSRMSQRGANHGLLVSATRLPVPTGNDAFYKACWAPVPTHCLELCIPASFACGRGTRCVLFTKTA